MRFGTGLGFHDPDLLPCMTWRSFLHNRDAQHSIGHQQHQEGGTAWAGFTARTNDGYATTPGGQHTKFVSHLSMTNVLGDLDFKLRVGETRCRRWPGRTVYPTTSC